MDTAAIIGAGQAAASWAIDLLQAVVTIVVWLRDHWWLLVGVTAVAWAGAEVLMRRLAAKASKERMALELYPAKHFDPGLEEIFRRGIQLARASGMQPWWAPLSSQHLSWRPP